MALIGDVRKEMTDLIPRFNGDKTVLEDFIGNCEFVIEHYADPVNVANPINSYLIRLIISRLEGRAKEALAFQEDRNTWAGIKRILYDNFGTRKDECTLIRELVTSQMHRNESAEFYGNRIRNLRVEMRRQIQSTDLNVGEKNAIEGIYDR
jgi:hypothetical protein